MLMPNYWSQLLLVICSSFFNSSLNFRMWRLTLVANYFQYVVSDEALEKLEEAPLEGVLFYLSLHIQFVGRLWENAEYMLHDWHEGLLQEWDNSFLKWQKVNTKSHPFDNQTCSLNYTSKSGGMCMHPIPNCCVSYLYTHRLLQPSTISWIPPPPPPHITVIEFIDCLICISMINF